MCVCGRVCTPVCVCCKGNSAAALASGELETGGVREMKVEG